MIDRYASVDAFCTLHPRLCPAVETAIPGIAERLGWEVEEIELCYDSAPAAEFNRFVACLRRLQRASPEGQARTARIRMLIDQGEPVWPVFLQEAGLPTPLFLEGLHRLVAMAELGIDPFPIARIRRRAAKAA